ncbi:hypothetical protein Tco_0282862 [Tanacetum coccineum]
MVVRASTVGHVISGDIRKVFTGHVRIGSRIVDIDSGIVVDAVKALKKCVAFPIGTHRLLARFDHQYGRGDAIAGACSALAIDSAKLQS